MGDHLGRAFGIQANLSDRLNLPHLHELAHAEDRHGELQEAMAAAASDAERLSELSAQLTALSAKREDLESLWLELSEDLES